MSKCDRPAVDDPPMDRRAPAEVDAHIRFMNDFAARLEGTGEFVGGQALAADLYARAAHAASSAAERDRLTHQAARVRHLLDTADDPSGR